MGSAFTIALKAFVVFSCCAWVSISSSSSSNWASQSDVFFWALKVCAGERESKGVKAGSPANSSGTKSAADAEKLMSAGTILGRIQKIKSETSTDSTSSTSEVSKPVFNPFEKKES